MNVNIDYCKRMGVDPALARSALLYVIRKSRTEIIDWINSPSRLGKNGFGPKKEAALRTLLGIPKKDELAGLPTRARTIFRNCGACTRAQIVDLVTSGRASRLRNYGSIVDEQVREWAGLPRHGLSPNAWSNFQTKLREECGTLGTWPTIATAPADDSLWGNRFLDARTY